MIKKVLLVAASLGATVLAALAVVWAMPPDLVRIGANYSAKIVCSNVFLAHRDAQSVLRTDVQALGHPLLRAMRVAVDPSHGVGRAGLFGFIGGGLAVFRPGEGCTVVPPPSKGLWPDGAEVHTEPPPARRGVELFDRLGADSVAHRARCRRPAPLAACGRLFQSLGMRSAILEKDVHRTIVGSSYMYPTPRDWARYGLLLAQDGWWGTQEVLPRGYVPMMRTPVRASSGRYGQGPVWLMPPTACPLIPFGWSATTDSGLPSSRRESGWWSGSASRRGV